MKKYFLVYTLSILCCHSFAQSPLPTYPEVLRQFFTHYTATDEYDNYTSFSKKKDGWYVQQVHRLKSDSLLNEHLFWPIASKTYSDLSDTYGTTPAEDPEKKVAGFLNDISFYSFERCRYYGYNGWNSDMIRDFGSAQNLSDTMLEGLSRAYSSYASTYLWYQSGGAEEKGDTLQRMLGRTEIPSAERINKALYNIEKSISTLQVVEKRNPAFGLLVGNAHLKVFNENMHGYMQMMFADREKEARHFIDQITLDEPYRVQARNYLNSCDSNAILFSFSDNDTYQLWYIQEKEGYRKDIAVINSSLLGLPIYLEMLRRKMSVKITTPVRFYEKATGDVVYCLENKEYQGPSSVSFATLEKMIYERQFPLENIYQGEASVGYASVPVKQFSFPLGKAAGFLQKKATATSAINIKLQSYLPMNDLLLLNIAADNSNSRPIYFTSFYDYFEDNLLMQGIVRKLVPTSFTSDSAVKRLEAKGLEDFLANTFHPVLSDEKITSYDGDQAFAVAYALLVYHYAEKKQYAEAKKWLQKAIDQLPAYDADHIRRYELLARVCVAAKDRVNTKKFYEATCRKVVDNYFYPNAVQSYKTKAEVLEYLQTTINLFRENQLDTSVLDGLVEKLQVES
ncbi:hypothetical protein [Ferruginibacter sp. HRS2-29]|uniref:hypothetical protein n=1 Tax=Ferruginibacter sp. HRS2-29 TaxID=2487334 RepID=UPI0020CD4CB5|nr:hypothetical protein [Ferruginibacter sp. HRS2-29]MCP9752187.1 hypothetical protein [Ferruginibacter sp. HRS2-29]